MLRERALVVRRVGAAVVSEVVSACAARATLPLVARPGFFSASLSIALASESSADASAVRVRVRGGAPSLEAGLESGCVDSSTLSRI